MGPISSQNFGVFPVGVRLEFHSFSNIPSLVHVPPQRIDDMGLLYKKGFVVLYYIRVVRTRQLGTCLPLFTLFTYNRDVIGHCSSEETFIAF